MLGASDGGGGGLPPFLLKTYEMVDDTCTDDIVSWSYSKKSFVVWNPPEFSRLLLPTYFKHNNFSSFIRQLNTYGFRKIDPERWEFANEDFVKGQKNRLKNIYRRKPIHSHSHPPGSLVDAERAALDEKIDRLSRERAGLQSNILRIKQQKLALKLQYEDLSKRIDGMEKRQEDLLNFFDKALQKPTVVEYLLQKIQSMDLSASNKKRRLPEVGQSLPVSGNDIIDVCSNCRPEFGNIVHLNLSDKLRLELSPAISDKNLVSLSTLSSNEDGRSAERIISEEHKVVQTTPETLVFSPENLDPSDAGISFTFKMNSPSSRMPVIQDSARLHSLHPSLSSTDEGDIHLSCHLNLTLASCPSYMYENYLTNLPLTGNQKMRKFSDTKFHGNGKESGGKVSSSQRPIREVASLSSSKGLQHNSQDQAPVGVNDLFWEQFLTERTGYTDNEEAHSNKAKNLTKERMEGSVMSFLKI